MVKYTLRKICQNTGFLWPVLPRENRIKENAEIYLTRENTTA